MELSGGLSSNSSSSRRRLVPNGDTSPDQARLAYTQHHQHHHHPQYHQHQQQRFMRPLRKVQIIYYLCRNGQLEHPHFMELPCLPNQHLRLKDVTDRLTVLRGEGMPSLYSWSCKRSYKNGYVWNDLSENDIIYPADGVEYVLKGSEIIPGTADRFRALSLNNHHPKLQGRKQRVDYEVEQESDPEEHVNYARSNRAGHSATDRTKNRVLSGQPSELPLDDISPPSSSSSDKIPVQKGTELGVHRFEDGDPVVDPGLNRNSMLLQLISCGSAVVKGRSSGGSSCSGLLRPSVVVAGEVGGGRKNCGLQSGLVSRNGNRQGDEEDVRSVSDKSRCGYPLLEDKEYFSGSIVEGSRGSSQPCLKKSSSYNEERSSKLGIDELNLENTEQKGGGVKAKCIPGRRKSSVKQQ